jgi:hypothetical protein
VLRRTADGCGVSAVQHVPPPSGNTEFRGSFAENFNLEAFLQRLGACAPVSNAVGGVKEDV